MQLQVNKVSCVRPISMAPGQLVRLDNVTIICMASSHLQIDTVIIDMEIPQCTKELHVTVDMQYLNISRCDPEIFFVSKFFQSIKLGCSFK